MADETVFAGIDIGGTNIKYGLVDSKGKILFKEQRPTLVEKGAEPLMHLVGNIAERLLDYAAEENFPVTYLGVGSPGAIDSRQGKVISVCPNIAGWQGMEIGRTLRDRLNMPVYVENDVNAAGLAEARFGAAVGYKSAVCVAVGTGVGGAVIIDGKLWRGANYSAGEIGHITLNPSGPKCGCGNSGCMEAYCSSAAMLNAAKARMNGHLSPIIEEVLEGPLESLTIKKLFVAAKKGDEDALAVITETAQYLGAGLAGVVNLLNPEIVVIGGGVADGGAGFVETVTAEVRRRAFSSATEHLRIARATLGNDAGFIGAGILGDIRN